MDPRELWNGGAIIAMLSGAAFVGRWFMVNCADRLTAIEVAIAHAAACSKKEHSKFTATVMTLETMIAIHDASTQGDGPTKSKLETFQKLIEDQRRKLEDG